MRCSPRVRELIVRGLKSRREASLPKIVHPGLLLEVPRMHLRVMELLWWHAAAAAAKLRQVLEASAPLLLLLLLLLLAMRLKRAVLSTGSEGLEPWSAEL